MTDTLRLSEMVTTTSSITYGVVKPGEEDIQGIRLVRSGDVIASVTNLRNLRTITQKVSDQYQRTILKGGELLVSLVGNPGEVMIAPSEFAGHNIARQVAMIRLKSDFDNRYVYYSLKSPKSRSALASLSKGSVQQVINLGDLQQLEIDVPALNDQKAIAHILGTLDDKIELNQKMNQTLEDIAKAIFKSWFVDFDPVRAKAEGRPTGLPLEISDLFPDELVDSEVGEIPEGCSSSTFGELADIQNGYAFKSKDWCEEGTISVVKIGNVKPMLVDVGSCSRVDSHTVAGLERFRLSSGDALIGMTGYVGEVGLVPKVNELPYLNQRVGRLIAHVTNDYSFMVVMARREEFKLEVENRGTGSAQSNVSASSIKSIQVVMPVSDLREKFGEIINPLVDQILTSAAEIEVLSELRDTLLPRLISGELRIPDAEKFLEEAGI